jgi:large subunit ribosomal protein L22
MTEQIARAEAKMLRTGQEKLNIVAEMIRGMKAEEALAQLTFSKRRIAKEVKKCLQSAIANAENNNNMNVDNLVVAEAYTGKAMTMKRFRARAKGRGARILKPFSNITIILKEKAA